jgi:hypothetical protein
VVLAYQVGGDLKASPAQSTELAGGAAAVRNSNAVESNLARMSER